MIKELHIRNYALISEIDIDFRSGLNIITGETGAGKSIIMGALSLLLGGRADMKVITDTSRKSVIEAVFSTVGFDDLDVLLQKSDIDIPGDSICILRRELSPAGRSRAFVNDTPVTLQTLREIAVRLVDIHSQHQNMLLADHDYQLSVIDTLASDGDLLEKYKAEYRAYREALLRYTKTRDMITRNKADAEFLTFQVDQLNEMNLQPGEQESLERERDMLANMSQIKEHLSGALGALTGGNLNALGAMAIAEDHIRRLSDVLDDAESIAMRMESAILEVRDIAETLQDYDAELDADPGRIEEVEQRLSSIYSLETKHHVDSSDELIALRDRLATQLSAIENADESLSVLHAQAVEAKKRATLTARELSQVRKATAAVFADELRDRAMPLGMSNLRCEIQFAETKLSPTGIDAVDFRFAFNKNQPLMSVSAGASGGEISRLVLSMKFVIAEKMQLPTIIFDEVDTGVSGDVALRMARLMASISERSQVIAITHLPQVAAQGCTHYKVYKLDDEYATTTRVKMLTDSERVQEIALMLSGDAADPAALATAASLLGERLQNKQS